MEKIASCLPAIFQRSIELTHCELKWPGARKPKRGSDLVNAAPDGGNCARKKYAGLASFQLSPAYRTFSEQVSGPRHFGGSVPANW